MKQKWGREESAGDWPSGKAVWTIGAVFVALVAAGAISAYRYARVWTPLERNYLTAYLATDAGALRKDGWYTLLMVESRKGPAHLAMDAEVTPAVTASGEKTFALTEAAVKAGDVKLEWQRGRYDNARLHGIFRHWIYNDQSPTDLAKPALWGGLGVFVLGLIVAIPKDAARARERKHGRRLKGPELVTARAFNRRTQADGIGFVQEQSVREKLTGKERDAESGLDNFVKRYFGSSLGRFMTPDAFYKDSHVGDPQSWNEYAYARNNPLRYVDPTGQTATVSTSCSTDANNATTCNVNISASIAIYAQQGSNLTQDQLNQAAGTIQSSIQNAWSGSFSQDGVTYNVSTQVSVSVATSQDAAMGSGAQNVIGISNGNASPTADSFVNPKLLTPGAGIQGIDTGVWNFNSLGSGVAAHEFTHLLGVGDRKDGDMVLSNTDFLNNNNIPRTATSRDFGWGVKEATGSVGLGLSMKSWYNGPALPSPFRFSTTDTVGAPWAWWK